MDIPAATIEFECGKTATNVGVISMAIRAHIGQCDNAECQQDCKEAVR